MPIGLQKGPGTKVPGPDDLKTDDQNVQDTNDFLEDEMEQNVASAKRKNIIIGVGVLVVGLGIFGAVFSSTKTENNDNESSIITSDGSQVDDLQTSGNTNSSAADSSIGTGSNTQGQTGSDDIYDANGNTIDPNGINPGITDYKHSTNTQASPYVYDASDYIKDLNGMDVSAVYNVASTDYIVDYVSYETRRAEIDDGMELYWLEAKYSGKTYRIQVPFYYFKDLGTEGICKVEMEVLSLVGGGKIISYMQVVDDSYTGRK